MTRMGEDPSGKMTKSAKQNKTSEQAQKKMSWVNYVVTESCLVTTLQHGLVTVSNVIQHPLRPATLISSQMFLKKKIYTPIDYC